MQRIFCPFESSIFDKSIFEERFSVIYGYGQMC